MGWWHGGGEEPLVGNPGQEGAEGPWVLLGRRETLRKESEVLQKLGVLLRPGLVRRESRDTGRTEGMRCWRQLWHAWQAPWLREGPSDTSWLPGSYLGPGSPVGLTGTFRRVSVWSPVGLAHLRKWSQCRVVLGKTPSFPCLWTWPAGHGQLWPPTHRVDQRFPFPRSQNTSRTNTT